MDADKHFERNSQFTNAHIGSQKQTDNFDNIYRQKQNQENIWGRNVNQNINFKSPSNILWNHSQYQSHCQKS